MPSTPAPRVLVIGCGALARELLDVVRVNDLSNVTIECLPGILHNSPSKIPAAVKARIDRARPDYDTIFVGYADCGTGGLLDALIEEEQVERLPGAHCYEFFAGSKVFADLQDAEPGTLYLTDYLVKHFDLFVWQGLGLDRYPQLRDDYFGNYTRVVYLAQVDDPVLVAKAEICASRLGLNFETRLVGYGEMEPALIALGGVK